MATPFIALPGYAETLHVPLRAGRTFAVADNVRSDPAGLVDERLASSAPSYSRPSASMAWSPTRPRGVRETAVRRALGADTRAIVPRLDGVLAGAAGTRLASRSRESLLFQVNSTPVPTFIVVARLLAVVALLASTLPATRVVRVDPMLAPRAE